MDKKLNYSRFSVVTDCSFNEQLEKLYEEFAELNTALLNREHETHWVEEANDVIQSLITLIENHSNVGFVEGWRRHLLKMKARGWKPRDKK